MHRALTGDRPSSELDSVQLTEMLTEPSGSSGSKSFVTVKVTEARLSSVLVIVHAIGFPVTIATLRQPPSLAV